MEVNLVEIKIISVYYETDILREKMLEYISNYDNNIQVNFCNLKDYDQKYLLEADIVFIESSVNNIELIRKRLEQADSQKIIAIYYKDTFIDIRLLHLNDYIEIEFLTSSVIESILNLEDIKIEISKIFLEIKKIFQGHLNFGLKIKKSVEKLNYINAFVKVGYYELVEEKFVPKYFYELHNEFPIYNIILRDKIYPFIKECETVNLNKKELNDCGIKDIEYSAIIHIKLNGNRENLLVIDIGNNQKYYYLYEEFLNKIVFFLEIEENRLLNNKIISESDSKFKVMIENSQDAIVVLNDGQIKFINSRFIELTGYSMFEVLDTHIENYIISYNNMGEICYDYDKIDFVENEYRLEMLHLGGSIIYAEVRGVLTSLMNEDSVILFINDVTDFQLFQNEIEEAKSRLDSIISSMDDTTLLILDELGKVIFLKSKIDNDQKYGIDFLNSDGKYIKDFLPMELFYILNEELVKMTKKLKNSTLAYQFFKNGIEYWFEIKLSLLESYHSGLIDNSVIVIFRDITQIKRAEQDSFKNAKYLEEVFNNVADGVFILDINWQIKEVNKIFQEIFDYEKEEIVGESFSNIFNPRDFGGDFLLNMIKEDVELNKIYSGEYILKKKIMETFYAQIYITAMNDENGKVINYVGSIRDITESREIQNELLVQTTTAKKAEEQVRSINEYLRNIFNNMDDVVLVLDSKGNIKSCNGAYHDVLGLTSEELVCENITTMLGLDVEFNESIIDGEYSFLNKEHKLIYLLLKSSKDKREQIIITIHDITMIKEIQFEIEKNEIKFRSLFEVSHDAIMYSDHEGLIFDLNKSAIKMLSIKSVNKHKLIDFIYPDDIVVFDEMMEHMKNFYYSKKELKIISQKEYIDVELSIFSVGKLEEKLDYFVYIMRDITEQKRVNALKDEFVSIVSHELKTPITSIDGSLKLLLGGVMGKLSPKVENILELASRNSIRLIDLINDILNIQKMEAGQMQYIEEELNLNDIILSIVEESQGYVDRYGVNVKLKNIDNVLIFADKLKIIQVVTNLLSNAIKFSEKGSEVILYSEIIDNFIRVHIEDFGVGIPESFREKIYNKFSQSELSITRKSDGTGLGLSIAKKIVEHFGGRIDFSSEIDKGTDFYFDLPIIKRGNI